MWRLRNAGRRRSKAYLYYESRQCKGSIGNNSTELYDRFPNRTREEPVEIYRTDVAIIGAGPAGLACRETLKELGLNSIVIDSNDKIGGQFLMQTHAFFFFEKERRFGGMRGFDIAKTLAGDDHSGIFLHSTVWDILQNKRIAVKRHA